MRAAAKLATATSALAAGILIATPTVQGQNLQFKTDNVMGIANIEGNAKPQALDFDGDGDVDMFIGGSQKTIVDIRSANITYYENVDGLLRQAESPFPDTLAIPPSLIDPVLGDTAKVSPAFVDYDGDNDMDAFIGLADSSIIYYRNDGGTMVSVTGADNPFDGIKAPSHFVAPAFADIDGDGDMDAIIGKQDGYLAYYENAEGAFVKKEGEGNNPFDGINVGEESTPAFVDIDGDGDMDLFVGNKEGTIAFFENNEGVFAAGANNPFAGITADSFLGTNLAPAFGDVDGDGDVDAFFGNVDGLVHYFRNDDGAFNWVPFNPLGIGDVGNSTNNGIVDADGDGDLDVFGGNGDGFIHYSRNDSGTFVTFTEEDSVNNPLNEGVIVVDYIAGPAFADIDGDGDMDAFVGSYNSNIVYLRNDDGIFVKDDNNNPFAGIDPGDDENIAFVDWDGDGDMDAFIGNKAGEVKYYENTDGAFAEVAGADNPFDGIQFLSDEIPNYPTAPALVDIDNDGDLDAFVGTVDGYIRHFNNDGGVLTEQLGTDNPLDGWDFGRAASPDFGDIDGDGDMDLLVGNAQGLTYYFENGFPVAIENNIRFSQQTAVYPNPTSGMIRIEMDWNKGPAVISMTSLAGQTIIQKDVSGSQAEIDMGNLPRGIYLMMIIGEEGQAVKKVVKQ